MSHRYVPVAQRRAQEVRNAAQVARVQVENAAQKIYDDREERVHALLKEAKTIAGEDTPMLTGWLDENPVENYGDRTELESQVEELESHKDSFEEISFSVHGSSFLDRSVVEIWDSASMMERIQIEDFFKGFLAARAVAP